MTNPEDMRANSLAAYESLHLGERERAVMAVYCTQGVPLTDRMVATAMGSQDPNIARPRVTMLIKRGLLHECGSVKCATTGKTVRIVRRTTPPDEGFKP